MISYYRLQHSRRQAFPVFLIPPEIHLRIATTATVPTMSDVKINSSWDTEVGSLDSPVRAVSKREIGLHTMIVINHVSLSGSGVMPEINATTIQINAPNR